MLRREKQIQTVKPEKKIDLEKKIVRHPLLYIFSLILLVVISVTFIGAPVIEDAVAPGNNSILFGKYANRDIEFVHGNYFSNQREILGQNMNSDQTNRGNFKWEVYKVWRGAFERTAVHVGMLYECSTNKTCITSDYLNKIIIENGPYNVKGEFDFEAYENTPQYRKQEIRRDYRENALKEYYLTDYLYGNKTFKGEKDFTAGLIKEQRSVKIAFFPFSKLPSDIVKKYGEDNKKLFKRIGLSKITLNSESDAKQVLKIVKENPALFEETAKNQSKDAYAGGGGDMGLVYCYSLQSEFGGSEYIDKVLGLKKGDISDIVEAGDSWLILKCNSPASDADFESIDTLATVRSYISKFEKGFLEDKTVEIAEKFKEDALKNGIYNAASALDINIYDTEPFAVNYGGFDFFDRIRLSSGDLDLSSAQYSKDFFIQAFSLEGDGFSEPVILDNGIAVLRLKEKTAPAENHVAMLDAYYPQIMSQFGQNDISLYFLKSDKLQDNFLKVFSKYFRFDEE